jgi:hypothetical protein
LELEVAKIDGKRKEEAVEEDWFFSNAGRDLDEESF